MRRKRSILISAKTAARSDVDKIVKKSLVCPEVTVSLRRFTPEEIEELCQKMIRKAKHVKKEEKDDDEQLQSASDQESLSDAESSSSHSDVDSYKLRGKKISVSKAERNWNIKKKKKTPEKNFSSDSEVEVFADKYKLRKIKFSALRHLGRRGPNPNKSQSEESDLSDVDRKTLRKLRKALGKKEARKTGDDINFSSDSETNYGFKSALRKIKKSAVNKSRRTKVLQTKKYYISSDEDQDSKVDRKVAKRSRRSGRTERIHYKEKRLSDSSSSEENE